MNWESFLGMLQNWAVTVGLRLVIAVLILAISFPLIDKIGARVARKGEKLCERKNKDFDRTVYRTLSYILKIGAKVLVVLTLVSYVGMDTSAVSALLASLGVGVGLAVNGTLSNLAGGILLLFTRPFRDGDYISANGFEGTVEDILICNTKIRTNDNRVVYLPNGKLSTGEIVNYSEKPIRRVDFTFSVSYADDFEKAKALILQVAAQNPRVLPDPPPKARVTRHEESGIALFAAVWCKTEHYWDVRFDMNEAVKKSFDENGITIPFPQMDVHLDR